MSVGDIAVGPLLNRLLFLARDHQVLLESKFVNILAGIGVVEGIGRQLDPHMSLFGRALPVLLRTPASREVLEKQGLL